MTQDETWHLGNLGAGHTAGVDWGGTDARDMTEVCREGRSISCSSASPAKHTSLQLWRQVWGR